MKQSSSNSQTIPFQTSNFLYKTSNMKKDFIVTICRSLLILLFLYASVSKIVDPALFKRQMFNQPFPRWMAWGLLFIIPSSEIIISVMLMFEKTARQGLKISSILMALFTFYTALILLHFFSYVPCSCGGVIQKLTWPQHLVFNIVFTGLAVMGYLIARTNNTALIQKKIHSYS